MFLKWQQKHTAILLLTQDYNQCISDFSFFSSTFFFFQRKGKLVQSHEALSASQKG